MQNFTHKIQGWVTSIPGRQRENYGLHIPAKSGAQRGCSGCLTWLLKGDLLVQYFRLKPVIMILWQRTDKSKAFSVSCLVRKQQSLKCTGFAALKMNEGVGKSK